MKLKIAPHLKLSVRNFTQLQIKNVFGSRIYFGILSCLKEKGNERPQEKLRKLLIKYGPAIRLEPLILAGRMHYTIRPRREASVYFAGIKNLRQSLKGAKNALQELVYRLNIDDGSVREIRNIYITALIDARLNYRRKYTRYIKIRRHRYYKRRRRSKKLVLQRFKRRKLKRLSFKRKRKLQEKLARIKKKRIRKKEEASRTKKEEASGTKKAKTKKATRALFRIIKSYRRYKRTKMRKKNIRKIKLRRRMKRRYRWAKVKLIRRRRRLLKKKRLPLMVKFMLKQIVYKHPIKLTFDQKLSFCDPIKISDYQFARGYRSKRAKRHIARLEILKKLEWKYKFKYIAPFRYLRKQCKILGYRKNIHPRERYEHIKDIKSYIFTVDRDNIMRGIHRDVPCSWARIRRRPRMNGLINYDFLPFLD